LDDKTKIFNDPVDVYIAATGTNSGDLSQWIYVGWCRDGNSELMAGSLKRKALASGKKHLIGAEYIFRAMGLQTSDAEIGTLEGFIDIDIDIQLVNRLNPLIKYLIQDMSFDVMPDFKFDTESARGLELMASRMARKLSDFFDRLEISLVENEIPVA
jgi:hypothetical protein